jgi:Zn-dependent M28 family amino/carboxypeptidase
MYEKGAYTIFQAPSYILEQLVRDIDNHFQILLFNDNILFEVNNKKTDLQRFVKRAKDVPVFKADSDRIKKNIQTLQDFKTRYAYSENYTKSAKWSFEQFKKMGLEVKFHEYSDYGKKQLNIVAQKSFSNPSDKLYIVCAHLDSTSPKASELAPGADDNGSGVAGVLEVAEVLKDTKYIENIRFVLFAGEEVGLRGSKAYVKQLKKDGEVNRIKGVVNFDMIGFDKNAPISSLIETKTFCKDFISDFTDTMEKDGKLKYKISYQPFGSDHMPFLNENIPCFLFIEDEYDLNPNYHQVTDLVEYINIDLATEIVNVTIKTLCKIVD